MTLINKNYFYIQYRDEQKFYRENTSNIFIIIDMLTTLDYDMLNLYLHHISKYKLNNQNVNFSINIATLHNSDEIYKSINSYHNIFKKILICNDIKYNNIFLLMKYALQDIKENDFIILLKIHKDKRINNLLLQSFVVEKQINKILYNFYINKDLGILSCAHLPDELDKCLINNQEAKILNCILPLLDNDKKLHFSEGDWVDWTAYGSFWARTKAILPVFSIAINNQYSDKIIGIIFLYSVINTIYFWTRIDLKYIAEVKNQKSINITKQIKKKVFIIAGFNKDQKITNSLVYYIKSIREIAFKIFFISDNSYNDKELSKILQYVDFVQCKKHGKYDFGSYSIGFFKLIQEEYKNEVDEIIFCNDSVFGPVFSLKTIFNAMENKSCDFWGVLHDLSYGYYLQSWFLVFKKNVFSSEIFKNFMKNINNESSQKDIILKYEIKLTQYLIYNGFKPSSYDENFNVNNVNNIFYPLTCLKNQIPFVKKKSISNFPRQSFESIYDTINFIKNANREMYHIIINESNINYDNIQNKEEIYFSIIIPTYNRERLLPNAIESILNQTYQNFEIIIIDDFSSDNTVDIIYKKYASEIKNKKIRIIKNNKQSGVCFSRNVGLKNAQYKWIAYVDSDNTIRKNFLDMYRDAILLNRECLCFYSKTLLRHRRRVVGHNFEYNTLYQQNYIDLGSFVHSIDLYKMYGGFDETLRRLVDWDLILKYSRNTICKFIDMILVDYDDSDRKDRITNNYNINSIINFIHIKHAETKKISSIILTYNHEKYIAKAIESALEQKGNYIHEILISDDGSKDNTPQIIQKYRYKYPNIIKDISSKTNRGISNNYYYSILKAKSEFIAILEGDDYWIDPYKNQEQAYRLLNNSNLAMIFSKIKVFDENGNERILKRQQNLKDSIPLETYLSSKIFNLVGTFSTCMFKKSLFCVLPYYLFEYRVSEMALALYFYKFGNLGFINKTQTAYRQHSAGTWSGMSDIDKKISSFITRIQCFNSIQDKNLFAKFKGDELYSLFCELKNHNIKPKKIIEKYLKHDFEFFNNMLYAKK